MRMLALLLVSGCLPDSSLPGANPAVEGSSVPHNSTATLTLEGQVVDLYDGAYVLQHRYENVVPTGEEACEMSSGLAVGTGALRFQVVSADPLLEGTQVVLPDPYVVGSLSNLPLRWWDREAELQRGVFGGTATFTRMTATQLTVVVEDAERCTVEVGELPFDCGPVGTLELVVEPTDYDGAVTENSCGGVHLGWAPLCGILHGVCMLDEDGTWVPGDGQDTAALH